MSAEVRDLRERHRQIHTWGSANLLQTLFREALVDRVNLSVCPVVIGQGRKLFPEGTAATRFEQVEPPKSFPAGVMLLPSLTTASLLWSEAMVASCRNWSQRVA